MIKINNVSINNLKNISLNIPLNKFVCFVGKSGSGKSTLAINVIYSGYYHNSTNVSIETKPILFSQKVLIPNTKETVRDYLDVKASSVIEHNHMHRIIKLLGLDCLDQSQKIITLSLNTYNKLRFFKYLNSIVDEKLLIIDELGSGLCYEEAMNIVEIYKLLINNGFSIIAVEHSIPLILNSDYVVELGPDAGIHGGNITFTGPTSQFLTTNSIFIQNINSHFKSASNISQNKILTFKNITYLNYKDLNFKIPLNCLVTIIGGSGSGKTNLLKIVQKLTNKASGAWKDRVDVIYEDVLGKNNIRRPHIVDQSPISSNSRSIPLTYIGLMDQVRQCYAEKFNLPMDEFSFNGKGKCSKCNGKGYIVEKINKEEIFNVCPQCFGKRYKNEILDKKIWKYSIGEVLNKTAEENITIFDKLGIQNRKLKFLSDIGLSYLCLGQPSITLSGGECQRIKIARELAKKLGDRSVYILDTPSRGLHVSDINKLMNMFNLLKNKNNSIIVADNNPRVIVNSDWVIYIANDEIKYSGKVEDIPPYIKTKMGL